MDVNRIDHFCLLILFVVIQQQLGYCMQLEDQCPSSVKNHRYHFLKVFRDTCYVYVNREMFWDDARDYCWALGGEMVHILNEETMNFIKRTLNSRELGWTNNGVWNGASDLRNRGWEWTTGELLSYQYWAPGEPAKFIQLFSFENCCCMRRGDNWKWHDYHCHLDHFEYKFICQIPLLPKEHVTEKIHQAGVSNADRLSDDRVAIVGLAVGALVLIVMFCSIIFLLYRKHEQQKAQFEMQPSVLDNMGYGTAIPNQSNSDVSATDGTDISPNRPVSNIYLDPAELNSLYEDANKPSNILERNMNNANSGVAETARLSLTGAAASLPNNGDAGDYMASTVSEASGATSGYCSTLEQNGTDGEYVEMNGATGVTPVKNGHAGKLCNTEVVFKGANGVSKNNNSYVSVLKHGSDGDKLLDYEKPSHNEMHLYTNQAGSTDKLNLRPLPPIPNESGDEKSPLFNHV